MPPVPDWKSSGKNAELNDRLIAFLKCRGIEVVYKDLPGEIQGVSKGGLIEIDPKASTKTIFHECAHELFLHHNKDSRSTKAIRELQAEAVGYVVSRHFGLEGLQSPNYIALFGLSSQDFVSSLAKIQEIAREIILAISNQNIKSNIVIE